MNKAFLRKLEVKEMKGGYVYNQNLSEQKNIFRQTGLTTLKENVLLGKPKPFGVGSKAGLEKQKQEVMYLHCLLRPTWLRS